MTSRAKALLKKLRRQGVVIRARGDRLRVDAPIGVASPEIRDDLAALKSDILSALGAEDRILDTSLAEFERSRDAIELRVPWLDDTLWLVPHSDCIDTIVGKGVHRGRIWTAREMADLLSFPEVTRTETEKIGRLKAAFGAELILEDVPEERPRACHCCHGTLFWHSIHGATICAECHPPAAPRLVERWIETDPPEQSRPGTTWFGLGELSDDERRRRVEFLKKFSRELNESQK